MAKVFFIPYAKYELTSDLSPPELLGKIRGEISNHDLVGELTVRVKGPFSGTINLKSGKFRIQKRLSYTNSFNPNLRGLVVEHGSGSKINVTLRLPTFVYAFLTIFSFMWTAINLLNPLTDALWVVGGLGFLYAITFLGFNMGASAALQALREMAGN